VPTKIKRHSTKQGCLSENCIGGNGEKTKEGGKLMSNTFMNVNEVAIELGVSKSYAYKVVQKLNEEMKSMGYLTISGRVNKQYFMKKVCFTENEERK